MIIVQQKLTGSPFQYICDLSYLFIWTASFQILPPQHLHQHVLSCVDVIIVQTECSILELSIMENSKSKRTIGTKIVTGYGLPIVHKWTQSLGLQRSQAYQALDCLSMACSKLVRNRAYKIKLKLDQSIYGARAWLK